jgi:YD repeat-containing protein
MLLGSVVFVASVAEAHAVSPSKAVLRPGSGSLVWVADSGTCKADVTVTTANASVVQVWALDPLTGLIVPGNGTTATVPDAVTAYFLIVASSDVTTTVQSELTVCWIGEDVGTGSGNCLENNCADPHKVPVIVTPDPSTFSALPFGGTVGDPVGTGPGNVYREPQKLLELGGLIPVGLDVFYDSAFETSAVPAGHMGPGWRNTTDWVFRSVGDGAFEITTPEGRVARFIRRPPSWTYELDTYLDVPFQLDRPSTEFELLDPRSGLVYTFNSPPTIDWAVYPKRIEDAHGNSVTMLSTFNGPVTLISDGRGRQITLTYTSNRLTSASDGMRTVSFTYDGQGQLSSMTDVTGHTTTFQYDPAHAGLGQMVAETRPEGNTPYTQVFDAQMRVVQQADAAGDPWSLVFNPSGPTEVTDPKGSTIEDTHDAGKLVLHQDELGKSITLGHGPEGRRNSITDRLGATTSWSHHSESGEVETHNDALGRVTNYNRGPYPVQSFNVHKVETVNRPDGTQESFTYDALGDLVIYTNAAGNSWVFTYDLKGRPLTLTDPSGATTILTYNPDDTVATRTDAAGDVTSYVYDAFMRLVAVNHPDGTSRTWTLDAAGRVTSETLEDGLTTVFVYDDNGNLLSQTSPSGAGRSYGYDFHDRLSEATDGLGMKTAISYNEGHQVERVDHPGGGYTVFDYFNDWSLASADDALGNIFEMIRDDERQLISVENALGDEYGRTLNAVGLPITFVLPGGETWTFVHDAMDRVVTSTDPAGGVTTFARNSLGAVTGITAALPGVGTQISHDTRGNLEQITDAGSHAWSYDHELRGLMNKFTDPLNRETTHSFNSRGLPEKTTLPATLGTVDFTWTLDGLPDGAIGSDGAQRQWVWSVDNELIGGTSFTASYDAARRMNMSNGVTNQRDADGFVITVSFGPNKDVNYTYDQRKNVTRIEDWHGNSCDFGYDGAGQCVSAQRSSGVVSKWTYNSNGACTRERHGDIYEAEYVWGDCGNVKQRNVLAAPRQSVPLAGSQSMSYDAAGQDAAANHDDMGRVLADLTRQISWSTLSEPTSISDGVNTVLCEFDCTGRYVSREAVGSGVVESLVWNDALGGGPAIQCENGVDSTYLVTDTCGVPLWSIDAQTAQVTWSLNDAAGNLVATTDGSGAVQCTHEYLPFGEHLGPPPGCGCTLTFGAADGWVYEPTGDVYLTSDGVVDPTTGRLLARGSQGIGPCSSNPYLGPASSQGKCLVESQFDPDGSAGTPAVDKFAGDVNPTLLNFHMPDDEWPLEPRSRHHTEFLVARCPPGGCDESLDHSFSNGSNPSHVIRFSASSGGSEYAYEARPPTTLKSDFSALFPGYRALIETARRNASTYPACNEGASLLERLLRE